MKQYNNSMTFCQDSALIDRSADGRDRKWRERKLANELLAAAYDHIDPAKSARLRDCSKVLTFRVYESGEKRLERMNSCRVRLCPLCSWRRSLKIFYNTKKIIDYISAHDGYSYIFATVTLRNCHADELSQTLDLLLEGFNRLMQTKAIKAAARGWYRGLEVTHDVNQFVTQNMYSRRTNYYDQLGLTVGSPNPNFDTYHPHLHIIIAVNPSYFTDSRRYLSQDKLCDLWQRSCRLDYKPVCDLRRVQSDYDKAVAEISKYAAKSKDYIIPDDWDLTVDTVKTLDAALSNRRLVAYGGRLREVNKLLRLDDVEDGSLVDVGEVNAIAGAYYLESYFWYSGYRQYYRIDP